MARGGDGVPPVGFDPALLEARYEMRPVGVFRSPFRVHLGTPRQPRVGEEREGRIEILPGFQNLLKDLDGFSHIWVLAWLHHARGWNHQVRPPRDGQLRGLFATRAPHRPNPIGLSALELLRIEKRELVVGAHDIHDGSPILDVKPYLTYTDSIPDARCGWVDELGDAAGPDHREWPGAERPE